MKKYFVLYMATSADFQKILAKMKNMPPEQQKEMNEEWAEWGKSKDVVDMGAPLGKTKRVRASGIADEKNEVGGYSIIEADSHEEAAQKMQDNPHFKMIPGGWIDVMEVLDM